MPPLFSTLRLYNYQRRKLYDVCKFRQKLEQRCWLLNGNHRVCAWGSHWKMVISIQYFLISREPSEHRPLDSHNHMHWKETWLQHRQMQPNPVRAFFPLIQFHMQHCAALWTWGSICLSIFDLTMYIIVCNWRQSPPSKAILLHKSE